MSLTNNQLDSLFSLQDDSNRVKEKNNSNRRLFIASVASFAIFMTALSVFIFQENISIEQKIANEVAMNHIKLKPLEVKSSQFSTLRNYFKALDFIPTASQHFYFDSQSLLGARYCSIQGITAAQIRLKNPKSGNTQSLYQTSYNHKLFKNIPKLSKGEQPVTVYSKGIPVEIWVEKGVLFALTKD